MGLRLRGQELPKTIPSWGSLAITATPREAPGWLTSSATVETLLHPVFSAPGGAYKLPWHHKSCRELLSAFCTFLQAASHLGGGVPCPLSGSFRSCIQGSQQDLHSRLLWCGVPQGRLDGCGQANSQVVPSPPLRPDMSTYLPGRSGPSLSAESWLLATRDGQELSESS